jgi:hypothetical protein
MSLPIIERHLVILSNLEKSRGGPNRKGTPGPPLGSRA